MRFPALHCIAMHYNALQCITVCCHRRLSKLGRCCTLGLPASRYRQPWSDTDVCVVEVCSTHYTELPQTQHSTASIDNHGQILMPRHCTWSTVKIPQIQHSTANIDHHCQILPWESLKFRQIDTVMPQTQQIALKSTHCATYKYVQCTNIQQHCNTLHCSECITQCNAFHHMQHTHSATQETDNFAPL